MDKKKTTPEVSSPEDKQIDSTSTHSQRTRILKELIEAGSEGRTTIDLREQLNVMHPSGRVMELKEEGHDIRSVSTVTENAAGYKHRNARYVLVRLAAND